MTSTLRRLELRLVRGHLVHLRRLRRRRPDPERDRLQRSAAGFASFTDGLSNTLLGAEVKTYTPAYHDCGAVPPPGPTGPFAYPDVATVLASIAAAPTSGCKLATAPAGMPGGGHTHWCNGNSFYDGFTTALPPNTRSPAGSPALDSDMSSEDEDDGGPTYAAVTSRSYHPGDRQCPVRRRQRAHRQELDQLSDLARPGNGRRRRGRLGGRVLTIGLSREIPPAIQDAALVRRGSKIPCDSRAGCTGRRTGRSWPSCATGSHSIVGAGLECDDAQEHGLGEPAGVVEVRHRLRWDRRP